MNLILGILPSLLISTVAMAAAQLTTNEPLWDMETDPPLSGEWVLAERVCGVGMNSPLQKMEPLDNQRLSPSHLRLNIRADIIVADGQTEAFEQIRFAVVQRRNHSIEQFGSERKMIYPFEPDGSLTFLGDGEKPCRNGAGARGVLFINFVRTQP